MLDGSEVPEPPEVEGRVRQRGVGKGKISGSGMERVGRGSAH